MEHTSSISSFAAEDGARIALYEWQPRGDPKAIVVIAHGLAEHAARCGDFASALALHPDDRHEILSELDREGVRADVAAWLDAHLTA